MRSGNKLVALQRHLCLVALAGGLVLASCNEEAKPANKADVATATDTATNTDVQQGWLTGEPCQPLFGSACFSAWPGDFWTRPDASSATGRRVAIPDGVLPVNSAAKRVDPADWNLRDGASPVLPIVLLPPEPLDPTNLSDEAHTDRSLQVDSPTLLVDLTDDQRIRHIAELDQNTADDTQRALIIRPWSPLKPGHRYGFALGKSLKTKSGKVLEPTPVMQKFLTGQPTSHPRIDSDLAAWQNGLAVVTKSSVPATDLLAFWPVTIASATWTTEPARLRAADLHQRLKTWTPKVEIAQIEVDPAFVAKFPNLGSGPEVVVAPMHGDLALRIRGTFETPLYLTGTGNDARLDWQTAPKDAPTTMRPFVVLVPRTAVGEAPAPWFWYGHGFLRGGCIEGCVEPNDAEFFPHLAAGLGHIAVAGDWWGLSQTEFGVAIDVSTDFTVAPRLTEKLLQGAVQTQAMTAAFAKSIATLPRFQVKTSVGSLVALANADQAVLYYGNSLGGIMGTTAVALHPSVQRAVLNVPGAVWSTMMNRSSNFDAFLQVVQGNYPNAWEQQVGWSLLQSHWDLTDPVHFAPLVLAPPLHESPAPRRAMWLVSQGDSQVPNLATGMLQRAAQVPWLGPPAKALAPDTQTIAAAPFSGPGVFVAWDSDRGEHAPGNGLPTPDNGAHLSTRWMIEFKWQVQRFLTGDGVVEPRYCLPPHGRDKDGQLPCNIEQAIPATATDLPDFLIGPPAL